jgi:hypothetical protein
LPSYPAPGTRGLQRSERTCQAHTRTDARSGWCRYRCTVRLSFVDQGSQEPPCEARTCSEENARPGRRIRRPARARLLRRSPTGRRLAES